MEAWRLVSAFARYRAAGVWLLCGRAVNVLGGFFFIFFLTQLLPKQDFGEFFVALSVVLVLGALTSAFFQRLLLYRASGMSGDSERRKLLGAFFLWSGVLALGVAGAVVVLAGLGMRYGVGEGPARWLAGLALLVVLDTWKELGVAWYRASQQIGRVAVLQEGLPNVVRVGGLGLCWLAGGGAEAILGALYLGGVVPVAFFLADVRPVPRPAKGRLRRGDMAYGLNMVATQAVNQPSRRLDVVLLGILASAVQVADYAVASRIASFLLLGKHLVTPLLAPRLRWALSNGDRDGALVEYGGTRIFSGFVALVGCLALLVLGRPLLAVFGNYAGALSVLLVLAAAMLVRAMSGASGEYLAMVGRAREVLVSTILGIVVMVAVAIMCVAPLGALGMAYAMLAGAVTTNGLAVAFAARREGVWLMDWSAVSSVVAATLLLVMVGAKVLAPSIASVLMAVVTVALVLGAWRYWQRIGRLPLAGVARRL